MKGFIKLSRSILSHWIYDSEAFDRFHAWIDLIFMAKYKGGCDKERDALKELKPGQLVISDDFLAKRWHWSRGKVRRYIEILENQKMLKKNSTRYGTVLTLINYGKYQGRSTTSGTSNGTTGGTTGGTHTKKDKEREEGKMHKKERIERLVDSDGYVYTLNEKGLLDYTGEKVSL